MNTVEPLPELVIEAGHTERRYWHDIWRYRELLGLLAWRDVKVRYQQTILGIAWAVLQPLAMVGIFTFVFGRLAEMPSGGAPYFMLVLAGQLAWQLFANSVNGTAGSIVSNSHLISKIYFPRLLVPLSTVAVALLDFLVLLALFAGAALSFGIAPGPRALLLLPLCAVVLVLALGAGLWLAALTVRFRDFRIIVPFLLQVGIFATPIGYRTDYLPNWQDLLALNPMTGAVNGFRWCLLGPGTPFDARGLMFTIGWAAVLLVSGVWYFRRVERSFADIV